MNKIQLCGMLLFCSNDTYFTAGSPPTPPLPSLVISWNTDFLLVSKGREGASVWRRKEGGMGKERKEGEGGEEAGGGEVKEGE